MSTGGEGECRDAPGPEERAFKVFSKDISLHCVLYRKPCWDCKHKRNVI